MLFFIKPNKYDISFLSHDVLFFEYLIKERILFGNKFIEGLEVNKRLWITVGDNI